jgi:fatty acid desaturase
MVPEAALLPDVLPTERLQPNGMPRPALRAELRRIPNGHNVLNVLSVWIQSFGLIGVAVLVNRWWGWVIAFVLMGRAFALYAILSHEAAHRLLFSNRRANDLVGRWGLSYPAFVPFDLYRRSHFAHHKDEMGPEEPDVALYRGYPITKASMRRKLRRDADGETGWKNLKGLLRAFTSETGRPIALRILAAQVGVAVILTVQTGRWWAYPVLWLAPWMTVWRVINRLRSIAEHGGMIRSKDRRETTHVVRQSWLARFWMVPFNTGYHLAHHVDMGVPFRHLPALNHELEAAGWVTPDITYPTYRSLWRALSSRPAA